MKPTWFFIAGLDAAPDYPITLDFHTHRIGGSFASSGKQQMSRRRRAETPVELAKWLVAVAQRAVPLSAR